MTRRSQRGRRAESDAREYLHSLHSIEEALLAGRRPLHRLLVRRGPHRAELERLVELARKAAIPIEALDSEALEALAGPGDARVQAAILEAGPLPELRSARALVAALQAEGGGNGRRIVALDGVEDPQNVGAIVRAADAAGARGLVLTQRRAPPLGPALARASAGAIEWMPVARVPNLVRALGELKQAGFWVVGADVTAERTLFELPDRLLSGDVVVVLGAEGRGMRRSILEAVDHPVRIPMMGRVGSMNVATAGAVVLFELLRRSGR
jgi:23S rRNA (guanosine2251-2'-O)-methyltransferase